VFQGNFIGTDAGGTFAVPNAVAGMSLQGNHNTVGGTVAGAGNVVSGNTLSGIIIGPPRTGTVLAGNFIGTNALGTATLAKGGDGVQVSASANNIIGTTEFGQAVLTGQGLSTPGGMAVATDGTIYVVDGGTVPTYVSSVSRIDPVTGVRTVISTGGYLKA